MHSKDQINLRSYPPSLYLDTGKEGRCIYLSDHMFKNQILVFFSDWSINNTCGLWFVVFWLAVMFQRDFRPEAAQKTEWFRRSEFLRGRSFLLCSLKPRRVSGIIQMFGPEVLSAGFLKTTKVLECFRTVYKTKTAIYFLARLLGSPRPCSWYYS